MSICTTRSQHLHRLISEGWDAVGFTTGNPELQRAERCFRAALELLREDDARGEPLLAAAWDGLGYVCDVTDRLEDAETYYLHSLAAQQAAGWPPDVCDDLTLLRLGQLYGRLGKHDLQRAVISRMAAHETCSCRGANLA
jgi:tetratricopeptide (TPR) repeat protein